MDLHADHKRPRFWLLAVKDEHIFKKVAEHVCNLPKFRADFWLDNPHEIVYPAPVPVLAPQKRGVGNAQAPIAAAIAFRILVNRLLNGRPTSVNPTEEEIDSIWGLARAVSRMFCVMLPVTSSASAAVICSVSSEASGRE